MEPVVTGMESILAQVTNITTLVGNVFTAQPRSPTAAKKQR